MADTTVLSHGDIKAALNDQLNDDFPGQGAECCDTYGDGESGDVVYKLAGDWKKAPYQMGTANGKRTAMIDHAKGKDVVPRTMWDEEAQDGDSMASMMGEGAVERFPGSGKDKSKKLTERFISKDERDKADSSDFAGKGKSFPILKKEDVSAAVHAMGRAGADNHSIATIKANIIKIAKRKGWESELPDAWKGGDPAESAVIDITGDCIALKEGAVGQDGTAYLKLIQPGWGSSGYYSPELLERDGPTAFPAGTKNYWNHQTEAEESARPEGDLRDLASVTTEAAKYMEKGPAGPGLYAKAKVFDAYKQPVNDLAQHIGVSIRASGKAKEGVAPDGKKGRIIEQLTSGKSVDYVTTPGAGGKILQLFEAARSGHQTTQQGDPMEQAALQSLQESNRKLQLRLLRADAREAAERQLRDVRIPQAAKAKIVERCVEVAPAKDGELDAIAYKTLVEAELTREAEYLGAITGRSVVTNMGAAPQLTEAQRTESEKQVKEAARSFAHQLNITTDMGVAIMERGRAAFDPTYNSARRTA